MNHDFRNTYALNKNKYFTLSAKANILDEKREKYDGDMRGGTNILLNDDYLLSIIEEYFILEDVNFIEIGGSDFSMTLPLSMYFNSYTGIEQRGRMVNMAKFRMNFQRLPSDSIQLIHGDINHIDGIKNNTSLADRKYDVMYMRNVFHLIDHQLIFDDLIDLMNDKSIIVIEQAEASPFGWMDNRFNKKHPNFDEVKWNEWKAGLESALEYIENKVENKDELSLTKYFIESDKQHLYVIKKASV